MQIGIQKKINGILFLSLFAVGLSIGIAFYSKYTDYMMKSVNEKLYSGLFSIYNVLDIESLNKLNTDSQRTREYAHSWKKIKSIQKEMKLAYAYIVLMNEKNQFYFVYDTGDDPTKTDDDNYLKIYYDAPSEAFESFASGKSIVVKGQYTDKWGTFMSAFYPIRFSGKMIGVIGADYNISAILELKKEALIIFLLILFLGLIAISLIGALINFWIVNPILRLNIGSRKIASGNLDYFIPITQNDEIGELARSFNVMAFDLSASFSKIQKQNEQLKERIIERTEELRNTLMTMQDIKTQQDGDYFLATSILESLMQNQNKSLFTKIDFLIEQKKKFNFKGKSHNLGGDISIAGNLNFFGKQFTMFFNGDATGKSMQGAGGALVIGSLVNSIMSRSAANNRVITKDPDRWLRETFLEIQKVMESFNGTILVSCILGVIEDETGFLQFFNAEHPLSVLYRDGVASFIESGITASKLGMPLNLEVGLVQFQLKRGDIVLCGSDGREDLILGKNSDGSNIMNEDQGLFLNVVEKSDGHLDKIYENLVNTGELSDDLSLVCISYMENHK